MKKVFLFVSLLLIVLLAACGGGQTANNGESSGQENNQTETNSSEEKLTAPDKFLVVGSGPMGSGWYPITTILSETFMDNFSNLNVSQLEGGSVSNLKSLEIGDIQFGINYTSNFADAVKGAGGFEKELENVASFASLYPVYQTIATLQSNEDINKVEDIVSKHIFLGPKAEEAQLHFGK
jgi:TRAP-type uncharacterized transport system substrate-binding protein